MIPAMELALSLPAASVPPSATVAFVKEMADAGYGSVWASEVAGPDFPTLAGAVAASTDLPIGVAVLPVYTRTAMVLAMTAATLAEMTGGRFTLGLGTSSDTIVEGFSGMPFDKPLTRLRETVQVCRALFAGERVTFEGKAISMRGYRLPLAPPPIPIWTGALNPRSLRMAGEIADGVCLNQLGPEHLPQVLGEVKKGAEKAGRSLDGYGVMARLFCLPFDDVEAGRTMVRRTFAPYAATNVYNRFFRSLGYEAEMDALLKAYESGDRAGAGAALSDRMIDACYVVGPEEAIAERITAYVEAGVTVPVVQVAHPDAEICRQTLHGLARRLADK